jgi:hypothetical protein
LFSLTQLNLYCLKVNDFPIMLNRKYTSQIHKHVVLHEASKTTFGCFVLLATTLLDLPQFASRVSVVVLNRTCELSHWTYNAAYRNNGQRAASPGVVCKLRYLVYNTSRAIAVALFCSPHTIDRIVSS